MALVDRIFPVMRAHPRLFLGIGVGIAVYVLIPHSLKLTTRLLLGWNAGTWFYFLTTGWLIVRATPESIRWHAKSSDEGRFFILILASVAAIASIGAIIAQLAIVKDLSGVSKALHIGLAAATIVSAWFFIHLTYALHYAHEYFDEYFERPDRPPSDRGGLKFPGGDDPDYFDFLYFSYVIGVASQTADVELCSREMRRVALGHCVLAFFFNSAVLALTINIAAGLI
ncbi:DUF1345 domain-containing protein [Methylocapsa palsarum]|uniref:Uncharacterized membrane protein n=1 Tax=Methylocapsa palsarum TaxID=1612308 RepID=A0A1I3XDK8_9HYPH|nr:DUF1345 domain-containing protein [Methylocapsa palsarum]SFK17439.1 Uncharacterized membrane protein [Methylocapsa palsarum]